MHGLASPRPASDRPALTLPTRHIAEIELPRPFSRLYELAYNLWWTWTPEARDLFAAIDRRKWGLYRNPVQLLINVDPRQWYSLVDDDEFNSHYQEVIEAFDRYLLGTDGTWFDRHRERLGERPIAYFSMEYGLHQSLQIYSGGLGVLSGDHCKSASDLGVPFVAVGLLYRRGYFMQSIDAEGFQQHVYPEYDFSRLPLRPIASPTGGDVRVTVRLPGRDLHCQLWLAQVGRVPLILLDTDLPENQPEDRPITNQLYVRGREMRLLQEMVLGLGGVEALRALDIDPAAWHLNEGHSVFLQLGRFGHLRAGGTPVDEALEEVGRNAVFTTHTPVPAGNEQFDPALIRKYFDTWCDEVGLPLDRLLSMGRAHAHDGAFNLTALAVRLSSWQNGVSKLNAEVASDMWRHLFPGTPDTGNPADDPIQAITNGVHARTWMGRETQTLLRRRLDEQWESMLLEPEAWSAVRDLDPAAVWSVHLRQKDRLARFVRSRLREQFARHGAAPDELRALAGIFDPEALTIGFARRFATYKRASLVFSDIERLRSILSNSERPVQLVFAGKAHPADRPGQKLIQHIFELSRSDTFRGKVTILENYDMRMGRMLTQGVDVWLNTPRRPMEASGTSGQKVAMNGGLNLSIADGWWPEGYNGRNGWVIGDGESVGDDRAQDHHDAAALYHLLEFEVAPLFYERDGDDVPHGWVERMKEAMASLTGAFSASRMVGDYVTEGYLPAAERGRGSASSRRSSP